MFHGELVKKATCILFVLLGLALYVPSRAAGHADTTAAQRDAQKNARKSQKEYRREQKKARKSQNKAMKNWEKQHPTARSRPA